MRRLVVVGAGISGLCAAWEAARRAPDVAGGLEVLVLERSAEVGGKARSVRRDGWLVETGPTGYLDNEPELELLLQRAGLADRKLEADPAAARRYVLRGKLREVAANPLRLAASGIFGPGGLLRLAAEPFIPRRSPEGAESESIHAFAARRLGSQAADRLIAPMVLGVFAGDPHRLSLAACFPRLAALEREHGSLIRGMIAGRAARSDGRRFAAEPSGKLVSFAAGLQSLPQALAGAPVGAPAGASPLASAEAPAGASPLASAGASARASAGASVGASAGASVGTPGFTVRRNALVQAVTLLQQPTVSAPASSSSPRHGAGFRIFVEGDAEPIPADALVVAGEALANAELIATAAPEAAAALREIESPPVAVVALGYPPEAAAAFPTGFGVLIPRDQGYRILGCIWDSQLFPGRSPGGHLLVRAMLGGAVDPETAGLEPDALRDLAAAELARIFGISAEPVFSHVARWPRAIPQYDLGHLARVRRIEDEVRRVPGLFLAGNALHGVAFAKSAVTGIRAGRRATEWLAGSR